MSSNLKFKVRVINTKKPESRHSYLNYDIAIMPEIIEEGWIIEDTELELKMEENGVEVPKKAPAKPVAEKEAEVPEIPAEPSLNGEELSESKEVPGTNPEPETPDSETQDTPQEPEEPIAETPKSEEVPPIDLDAMTLIELREVAKVTPGVDYAGVRKSELLNALKAKANV